MGSHREAAPMFRLEGPTGQLGGSDVAHAELVLHPYFLRRTPPF